MSETLESATEQLASAEVRTFLIADIRGYTRYTLEHGDEAAARFARRFGEIAIEAAAAHEGRVIELRGDEALAVFTSARQALRASVELQSKFLLESQESSLPYEVGIGLDSGEAIAVNGGYRGAALNLAARLCSLAGAGEVLASDTVANLARKIEGLEYSERGSVQVKGFADEVRVVEVHAGLPVSEAPSGTASQDVARPTPDLPLPIGGFLGALPSGFLVAREEELQKTLSIVDGVTSGKGQLVLLAGEPGAGKTRLAQEVTLAVRNRGFVVAAGSCYEPRQAVPYYPFLDALGTIYGAASPKLRSEAADRWPYLGRLLPEAGIVVSTIGAQGQEDHDRLFRAVTSFLQAVSREKPIAVFLDDLHWADEPSIDLLQHLARHTRATPVLILGTYRDVEVNRQHPLGRNLHALHREGLLEEITVRRLPTEGTAALVAATMGQAEVSEEFVSLLQRYTEGNPFFTQEVLRALVERGDIYRESGRWERREIGDIEVPRSVREAIGERFSRLSPPAQDILREASVLGQSFAFTDIEGMTEASEDDVEVALQEAADAALIRETGPDDYAFNHALTHQTLYSELPARRKRKLHLAAGEALQSLPAREKEKRIAELAWHFLEGDDSERSLPYLVQAGNAAEAIFAHREAKKHYETALELIQEMEAQSTDIATLKAEALENLGEALTNLSYHDDALERLDQALDVHEARSDMEAASRVTAKIGRVHRIRGTTDEGLNRIRELLSRIDGPDADSVSMHSLATLHSVLATLLFASSKYDEQLSESEKAAELAISCGDETILAEAEVSRGTAFMKIGRGAEGHEVLAHALPLVERAGNLDTRQRALNNLGVSCLNAARYVESRQFFERALEVTERADDASLLPFAVGNCGVPLMPLGDLSGARARFERARVLASSSTSSWFSAYPSMHLGVLCFLTGEWQQMERHFDEALRVASRSHDTQVIGVVESTLAHRDILIGEHQTAISRIEPIANHENPGYLAILAWAQLEAGNAEKALDITEDAVGVARLQDATHDLIEILIVKGRILTTQQEWENAGNVLDEVLSMTRQASFPHAEGRVLLVIGEMHAAQGDRQIARESLQSALAIFRNLGTRPYADLTEKSLKRVN